jgi:hypothetical protein
MKLLSPSPEAVATILGVSLPEAVDLLRQRREAELREREARQHNLARACAAVAARRRSYQSCL